MRRASPASFLLLGCLCACQATPRAATPRDLALAGNATAEPSLAALPVMMRAPAGMGERTHAAFTMANQIFENACPVAPSDRAYRTLSVWVESAVVPWLHERDDGVAEARSLFARNTPRTPSDEVVSAAVIGLLHEDTALALVNIPQPSELDAEPDIAVMFRDVIRAQAKPFLGSALAAYRSCADAGTQAGGDLLRWADFCRARSRRLGSQ